MRKIFIATSLMTLALIYSNTESKAAIPAAFDIQVKEKLNRAPVAVKTSVGILVSWRYLTTDGDASFSVYRNGEQIATGISTKTNYLDKNGQPGDVYKVVSSAGDEAMVTAWDGMYKALSVKRPSAIKNFNGSGTGRYRPDDMSVADLDGDGDYELVLKWMPDNAKDNSNSGYTSPCIFSAYEMDGTPLWSQNINLGYSIRTGNHYSPFLVYDLDGDGKAELICKTGSDSRDGKGNLVTTKGDSKIQSIGEKTNLGFNGSGHVIKGEELLTVFNGATGEAMNTIWYSPSRDGTDFATASTDNSSFWGDAKVNRSERFNACVAYLDGLDKLPSAIMERGYYNRCYLWAVDWDGLNLKTRWLHRGTASKEWSTVDANDKILFDQTTDPVYVQGNTNNSLASSYGMGVHGISVGDVNNDGYDEICIGSATIAHDGKLLCSTGCGHGDAIHLADLVPSRPGLEVMMPHEKSPFGYDVHDATTGELLAYATGDRDNGRGIAGDFIPNTPNANSVFWSSVGTGAYDCGTGDAIENTTKSDTNFRIYWTRDPFDQTFDGHYDTASGTCTPNIKRLNAKGTAVTTFQPFYKAGAAVNPQTCNYTKATPCLQADILGDWREEIVMFAYESDFSSPECSLLIYSTPEQTSYKVPCLMEDHVYRMGIVWQNSAYNQPPHLGYNLANSLGITRTKYSPQGMPNHSPAVYVDPDAPLTEALAAPVADKGTCTGTCYAAGAYGELTATVDEGYIKMRTGNNDNTMTFTVNSGYVITGIGIAAHSNNSSTTADRSITLTSIKIDDTMDVLPEAVIFPGGTEGTDDGIARVKGFCATKNIVLSFDNSKIVDSTIDANGKNKQIWGVVTFTYTKATDIKGIKALQKTNTAVQKVLYNGKIVIMKNGKHFSVTGQQM